MKPSGKLADLELLKPLSPAELEKLERLLLVKDYRDGHTFWQEGAKIHDDRRAIFFILQGKVAVSTEREEQTYIPVARTLKAGEIFGLISFLQGDVYSATCRTDGPVCAASLARTEYDSLFTTDVPLAASITYAISRQLARDVRLCNARLVKEI